MAEASNQPEKLDSVLRFRDGLMIAFLALVPLRLRNLSTLTIGSSLVDTGAVWIVRLLPEFTKTRRLLEYEWPRALTPFLQQYLDIYRPILLNRTGRWQCEVRQRLWVSRDGSPMPFVAVSDRIAARTRQAFGFPIRAHGFRHAAATTIAIHDPNHVMVASALLGHTGIDTTERTYNLARSLEAHRAFQRGFPEFARRA